MAFKIWINAFIPRDVPDYTETIPQGRHSGKTAVPLPRIARLNPFNLIKNFDDGYLTDQRAFDSKESASSRMHSLAEMSWGLQGWSIKQQTHTSSGTTEVDLKTGEQLDFDTADMSRCSFSGLAAVNVPGNIAVSQMLYIKGAAADPLVSAAADIDYTGSFKLTFVNSSSITIDYDLKIDTFPAFEGYVQFGDSPATLFTVPPPHGNTVAGLPGDANRPLKGSMTFTTPITVTP
jgi:hypothetical protein